MSKCFLGIHLGHDASAATIVGGDIRSYVLRERHSRNRHHYGIDRRTIAAALKDADLSVTDLAGVAITATQHMPGLIDDEDYLSFVVNEHGWMRQCKSLADKHGGFATLVYQSDQIYDAPLRRQTDKLILGEARPLLGSTRGIEDFLRESKGVWGFSTDALRHLYCFTYLSPIFGPTTWQEPFGLDELPSALVRSHSANAAQSLFTANLTVKIAGVELPGFLLFHHVAHAAASFFSSPFNEAAIVTNDGGLGPESGFIFLGKQNRITPISPHWLACGKFYEFASERIGLRMPGGPGKVMGLAGYARGALAGVLPPGNALDWARWTNREIATPTHSVDERMFSALVQRADLLGFDTNNIMQHGSAPNSVAAEIAFAVQAVTEECLVQTVEAVHLGLSHFISPLPSALCVSGGVALNCPANTRIYNSSQFSDMHIEPYCDDGGLSIGAALYVHHHLLGNPRILAKSPTSRNAMLGVRRELRKELEDAIAIYGGFAVTVSETWWRDAAADLARNKVIAMFQSRSEAGPRALGHRSILAHPGFSDNWRRLNFVKGRERWRPFGPIVLESKLSDWFIGGPSRSPYMLFTYDCTARCAELAPAIVHADGTSRIQTIAEEDGAMFHLLEEFERLTTLPLAVNTSFNGPGEPIVETVRDALSFLSKGNIDALYLEKFVIRPTAHTGDIDRRSRLAATADCIYC
jgi:carbamoyltransferase